MRCIGDKAFTGIAEEDRPAVIANAKRFQRVLRVAPEVDTAQTLLSLGIHSATQIATMGRQQFFTTATAAGLTKREANKVYDASAQRYAGLVSLVTQYNRDLIGIWPRASDRPRISTSPQQRRSSATSRSPRCSARRTTARLTTARRS